MEFAPKKVLMGKVVDLVTGFLSKSQISTSIGIIALDIHKMKQQEEILSDVYDNLRSALTKEHLKTTNDSYKAMVKDLGEGSDDALRRTKMIFAHGVSPAIEKWIYYPLGKEAQKTQDGGQDEAKRILNANKGIKVSSGVSKYLLHG
ncbi:hypothetical protein KIN20_009054 [Parelaphostrongylus tenuis]|uniref:Uncharacterized protein n=1 Tax=Parelaphostrongylus tenuis TaxID=148309 RepID=A0AAD5M7N1_PARTN|nr:hypothetical protein KIN20_009054 [Parelaphostrongylus tenuis]